MSDKSYKGSKATSHGEKKSGTKSHYEHKGIPEGKDSKNKIKKSFAGRHLHETEHHTRMGNKLSNDPILQNHDGNGPTEM